MPEHYSKNTLSISRWCNRCKRKTMFYVSDGRLGRCLEPHLTKTKKPAKKESKQMELF